MKFSSNHHHRLSGVVSALIAFLAVVSVQSFQPVRSFSPKTTTTPFRGCSSLRDSSSPENGDGQPFFPPDVTASAAATEDTVVESSSSIPAPNNGGAVAVAVATPTAVASSSSVTSLPAKTMDEGIYGFNKIVIDTVYDVICFLYPVKGNERDFARFYVLETVARVPYFAYLSVMHFKETFGERYDSMSDRMRTHYAEADNELHHLLIMESLGGNSNIIDRTLAQTMAFFYYWYVIVVYTVNEPAAYHLSELIEDHAFNTYSKFTVEHEDRLKSLPVPDVARKYYELDNPFLFDLFCTVKDRDNDNNQKVVEGVEMKKFSTRRPQLSSLYDVFVNIRDDEKEHWKTLCNLVQYDDMNAVDASEVQSTTPAPAAATSP